MHKTFIRNDIEVRAFTAPKALEPEIRKQYEELSLASAGVNAVKASRIARTAKRAAAVLALCTSAPAFADSVAGFGGVTETTQLLNNAELVFSVVQQIQMVEQNIQA